MKESGDRLIGSWEKRVKAMEMKLEIRNSKLEKAI
jgi:hypothetical protein